MNYKGRHRNPGKERSMIRKAALPAAVLASVALSACEKPPTAAAQFDAGVKAAIHDAIAAARQNQTGSVADTIKAINTKVFGTFQKANFVTVSPDQLTDDAKNYKAAAGTYWSGLDREKPGDALMLACAPQLAKQMDGARVYAISTGKPADGMARTMYAAVLASGVADKLDSASVANAFTIMESGSEGPGAEKYWDGAAQLADVSRAAINQLSGDVIVPSSCALTGKPVNEFPGIGG